MQGRTEGRSPGWCDGFLPADAGERFECVAAQIDARANRRRIVIPAPAKYCRTARNVLAARGVGPRAFSAARRSAQMQAEDERRTTMVMSLLLSRHRFQTRQAPEHGTVAKCMRSEASMVDHEYDGDACHLRCGPQRRSSQRALSQSEYDMFASADQRTRRFGAEGWNWGQRLCRRPGESWIVGY